MFSQHDLDVIKSCNNEIFESIFSYNYDGSIHIDVFDLYRRDEHEEVFLVIEEGNIRLEDNLSGCLSYINRWL